MDHVLGGLYWSRVSHALIYWGLTDLGGKPPHPGLLIPRDSKQFCFQMESRQCRAQAHHLPAGLSHSRPPSTCPHLSRARGQTVRDAPTTQSPPRSFKQASPTSVLHTPPVPSCRRHNKGFCPQFPFLLCLLRTVVLPCVAPRGAYVPSSQSSNRLSQMAVIS